MGSFWKSIKNTLRQKKDEAAEKLADPIRDGKYAIEDSEKKLGEIQGNIAKYSASIKKNQRLLDTEMADVRKWGNLSKKAAEAGKVEDVTKCVSEKTQAQSRADNLKKMIKSDEAYLAKMKSDWQKNNAKVGAAKSNHAQLAVRKQMAEARKEFAKGTQGLDSDNCFAQLDKLADSVETDECEAEALEEMAPSDSLEDMEAEYGAAGDGAVDDEVAKLMAAAAQKS
jgi:phage shock protein A